MLSAGGRRRLRLALVLAPPVLGVLFLGALFAALLQSFGYAPLYGVEAFPTPRYYAALFGAAGFWRSLGLSLYYAVVPTLLGAALSVPLALALNRQFRGRSLLATLYRLPLTVPYLVGVALTVLVWLNGGLLARALYALGLIGGTDELPRLLYTPGSVGLMLVYLWKQVPFQTLLVGSVLAELDRGVEAAARTLGATPQQTFLRVTLPRLLPGIVAATLLVFAFNFAAFEAPLLLEGGFPNTLPVAAWRAFDNPDLAARPGAMATVVVVTLFSGALLSLALTCYRRFEARGR